MSFLSQINAHYQVVANDVFKSKVNPNLTFRLRGTELDFIDSSTTDSDFHEAEFLFEDPKVVKELEAHYKISIKKTNAVPDFKIVI